MHTTNDLQIRQITENKSHSFFQLTEMSDEFNKDIS